MSYWRQVLGPSPVILAERRRKSGSWAQLCGVWSQPGMDMWSPRRRCLWRREGREEMTSELSFGGQLGVLNVKDSLHRVPWIRKHATPVWRWGWKTDPEACILFCKHGGMPESVRHKACIPCGCCRWRAVVTVSVGQLCLCRDLGLQCQFLDVKTNTWV